MRSAWTIIVCGISFLSSCRGMDAVSADAQAMPRGAETRFDFESGDVGSFPAGFSSDRTGGGPLGKWVIDEGEEASSMHRAPLRGRILAQLDPDATESRYLVCVANDVSTRDARSWMHFQARGGEIDQAAGIVVRYQDPRNYYLARANALEGNVRFYKVVDGTRKQLGSTVTPVTPKTWHKLLVEARGAQFRVEYDGTTLFTVEDEAIPRAGQCGLWTKADSVTWFDDLTVESFDGVR